MERMGRQKDFYYELYIPIYNRYELAYFYVLTCELWIFPPYFLPLWVSYLSINGTSNLRIFRYPRLCPYKVRIIFCILIATNHTHTHTHTRIFYWDCTVYFPARKDDDCKHLMT